MAPFHGTSLGLFKKGKTLLWRFCCAGITAVVREVEQGLHAVVGSVVVLLYNNSSI